mmetsp:Transcript_69528/g.148694  ORF Transcript_69528/g.148694 Transcript_69528/m.148694 type:complete len:418 (+) Transcript_69528:1291-2544(+)
MGDRLHHPVPLLISDAGHEAEVQDSQLALGGSEHVAGVWIRMEQALVEELCEVGHHTDIDQLPYIVGLGLGELLALEPACDMHLSGAILREVGWDDNPLQSGHVLLHLEAILALVHIVQLLEDPGCELVEEGHEVRAPLVPHAHLLKVGEEGGRLANQVKIQGDSLQHRRPLNLHRHLHAGWIQEGGPVDLPQRSSRHWLWSHDREEVVLGDGTAEFLAELLVQGFQSDGCAVRWHLVAELLQLHHSAGREQVRTDAQGLPQLDEERAQRGDHRVELRRPLHLHLGTLGSCQPVPDQAADQGVGGGGYLENADELHPQVRIEVGLELLDIICQRKACFGVSGNVDELHLHSLYLLVGSVEASAPEALHHEFQLLVLLHFGLHALSRRPCLLRELRHCGAPSKRLSPARAAAKPASAA